MRISDWSSDVCSSDLWRNLHPDPQIDRATSALSYIARRRHCCRSSPMEEVSFAATTSAANTYQTQVPFVATIVVVNEAKTAKNSTFRATMKFIKRLCVKLTCWTASTRWQASRSWPLYIGRESS